MATNSRPFACLRQQCPYRGANSLANMESHIMHEHDVRPWECAEPGCTVTCARRDALVAHMVAAHQRNPSAAEEAGNATIKAAVKAEAEATRVVPRAQRAAPAAPALPPGPLTVANPPIAPPVALPVAPPVANLPAAPPSTTQASTLDVLERPGYYDYYNIPYGTGPPIPGGRR